VFDIDPLAHDIDVEASSHRVLQPKIELKLVKKQGGIKWTKLEGEDESLVKMGASNLLELSSVVALAGQERGRLTIQRSNRSLWYYQPNQLRRPIPATLTPRRPASSTTGTPSSSSLQRRTTSWRKSFQRTQTPEETAP
jgi:hypothetical protein